MFKKTFFALLIFLLLPLAFSGCKKKPSFVTCKNDADCRIDQGGEFVNQYCYMNRCEECIKDSHCVGLKKCVTNRCMDKCENDEDCSSSESCEGNVCVKRCAETDECEYGEVCSLGRCVRDSNMSASSSSSSLSSECSKIANVYFDFDRSEVKTEHISSVEKLATCLKDHPGARVFIGGHTDQIGTKEYNLVLGEKRANEIKRLLVKSFGIDLNQIRTVSYGSEKPSIRENTEYAYGQNRRAEFDVQIN